MAAPVSEISVAGEPGCATRSALANALVSTYKRSKSSAINDKALVGYIVPKISEISSLYTLRSCGGSNHNLDFTGSVERFMASRDPLR